MRERLPNNLKDLADLAYNFWWCWSRSAMKMWQRIDQESWLKHENPVRLLLSVPVEKLEELSRDEDFLSLYELVTERFKAYMKSENTWFSANYPQWDEKIVYMCMEYGISKGLPIYSGGLGVLAGDHLKSASDLGLPLIAIGLLYKHGYFSQEIDAEGRQREIFPEYVPADLPITPLLDQNGKQVLISVPIDDTQLKAHVFKAEIGRVTLYLLDPDVEENSEHHRKVCDYLYNPSVDVRLSQEILLGIGGMKLLEHLGVEPGVIHLNEGHPALVSFERIRALMEKGLRFQEALELVKESTVFTTHTPVPAGHDRFPISFVAEKLRGLLANLPASEFLKLGKEHEDSADFNMTVLAIRTSSHINGVSQLHARVSREMFKNLWKGLTLDEIPIRGITNGVNTLTWVSREFSRLFDKYLSRVWREHTDLEGIWYGVERIPDQTLWDAHLKAKKRFIEFLQDNLRRRNERLGIQADVPQIPEDALIIGFARRFATYKRAVLIFKDLERLKRILNDSERPVYLVFAGKAHPKDEAGKDFLRQVYQITQHPDFAGKVFLLEDYDIALARNMVSGVDVWLNNPRRPQEASGTSGMKAAINGVLNLSVYDGWWVEGYTGNNGWVVGEESLEAETEEGDWRDAESLYEILEREVVPTYYGDKARWIYMMKQSMKSIVPAFSSHRMMKQYMEEFYVKALIDAQWLSQNDFYNAKQEVAWKEKMLSHWHTVSIDSVRLDDSVGLEVAVNLGNLEPQDVRVEIFLGREDSTLERVKTLEIRRYRREGDYYVYTYHNGFLRNLRNPCWYYAVRVLPAKLVEDLALHIPLIWKQI
ncbi:alpha-glucan family phosphorylase [Coprothermobacteraceae bacterium]|nr:alpha-glucan family phosphorylase [Coprothermobacteraceae bacterium]